MVWNGIRSATLKKLRLPAAAAVVALAAAAVLAPAVDAASSPEAAARGFEGFWGPLYRFGAIERFERLLDSRAVARPAGTLEAVLYWNHVAIDASGLDHTPVAPGENRVFGEQRGPGRASRAMAIVHIAMFDAINAIEGGYRGYSRIPPGPPTASVEAAIAVAARDTLAALFESQAPTFDALLAQDLASIGNGRSKTAGIIVGRRAAAAILSLRANDGSAQAELAMDTQFHPSDLAGKWRMDPISQIPVALGAHWGEVSMFTPLKVASRFRVPPPPAMESAEYAAAYDEVKSVGGDGEGTPTARTPEQTEIGLYWAYDGTPSLCAPPRLYNQIATTIAAQMGSSAIETARLLALLNVAMADAGTAIWESKYYYQVWRPIVGIREADEGTGPTGAGDGNPATEGDPTWSPLGAPASNLEGPNFTPPFPAYPSGHAGFGGAVFQILRRFYGTDQIAFSFVSDELNGVTKDNHGAVRPLVERSFRTLSQAEDENGQSRIYLGIHWRFDKDEGIAQGERIADHVFRTLFRPIRRRSVD